MLVEYFNSKIKRLIVIINMFVFGGISILLIVTVSQLCFAEGNYMFVCLAIIASALNNKLSDTARTI